MTSANSTKTIIRKANQRGHASHGWLNSFHTFSFGDYFDPRHLGFHSLRVINDDRVAPGRGFDTHPHRDMEIFSYVLEGELAHKDSLGNSRTLKPGQIQLMSAGRGVSHSEFNPSSKNETHFLQIWIQPRERGLHPSYTEWQPQTQLQDNAKVLMISPDARENTALIHQDAFVYRLRQKAGESVTHELLHGRGAWLHVISGEISFEGNLLTEGDAVGTEEAGQLVFTATRNSEALLFDLL